MITKKFWVLLLALGLLFSVGCARESEEPSIVDIEIVEIEAPKKEEPQKPAAPRFTVERHTNSGNGMTAAGLYHSLLLRSDGTVDTAGQNTKGQCNVNDWQDIVYVAAGDELSLGLRADGTLVYAGSLSEEMKQIRSWTEICLVSIGEGHILGLRKDGTVLAAGNNDAGQCDVSLWKDIASIAAAGKHSVALKEDGSILTAGDLEAPGWMNIEKIYTNADSLFAIDKNGRGYASGEYGSSEWWDLQKLAVSDKAVVGIGLDYSLRLLWGELDLGDAGYADQLSLGENHGILTQMDGSLKGLGENGLYQAEVDGFRIYPYGENGGIYGLAAGSTVEEVTRILKDAWNANSVVIRMDSMELALADPVPTGAEILADGESVGHAVIRGEVTGDGIVDTADYNAIGEHIGGTKLLEGVYLEAAQIYPSDKEVLRPAAAEAVRRYIDDGESIPQFPASGHAYDEKIEAARKLNPDVNGWIRIDGTNIDYPIMKATMDYKYNDHDWEGNKSTSASVYSYYNEARQGRFQAFTAHNSRVSGTMFHYLHHIYDYSRGETECSYSRCENNEKLTDSLPDLKTYEDRVWRISLNGVEGLWEVYSVYEMKEDKKLETLYNNIWYFDGEIGWSEALDSLYTTRTMSEEEIRGWIDAQIEKSEIPLDVQVDTEDELLTILTCATTGSQADKGGRLYFFLHRVG